MSGRPRAPRLRERARRAAFALSTLLGRPQGFFIPYRYAASVVPRPYPALVPRFEAAEPAFGRILSLIDGHAAELLRIRDGAGPARFDQDWFPRLDAAAAYAVVRDTRPRRIVEIGSGHSTRFLARAVADGGLATEIVAIDPSPRAKLPAGTRHHACLLADADPALWTELGSGDVLFIDSSHVAMPGTDLDLLVGDVLPRLPAGVLLHVHDILLPDPYPAEWEWRGYNEATVVAALLAAGGTEVVFSSHWVASRCPDWLAQSVVGQLPLVPGARETSLWLRTR